MLTFIRLIGAIQQNMVFLIFTRSNLYLGISGRITELLPFGEQAYLALRDYHFPDDLDSLFHLIRTEVEAYYDRTAFGVPSNLNVLGVYSPEVDDAVKRELNNEFADFLPVGWIWDASLQAETDHLDAESFEMQPISLRRMVKKIKSDTLRSKNISWQSNHEAGVQVLVPQSGSPLLPDPKRRMPELPKLPSLPNLSVSIPKVPKMPARPKMPSLPSINLPSVSLPAMPEMPDVDWRKYRLIVPGAVLFGIAGFLLWPDGTETGNRERNIGSKLAVEPVANHQTTRDQISQLDDTTAQYVESLTAAEIEELANRSAEPDSASMTSSLLASVADTPRLGTVPIPQTLSTPNSLGELDAEQTAKSDSSKQTKDASSETIAEAEDTNQINPNYQQAIIAEDSSLSLADIAENSREASFLGGKAAILTYFAKNMRYPKAAKRKDVKGQVVVGFEVDVEGRVVNPYIIKGIGFGCDDEAKRLVANMPNWNPATVMRKRVSSTHTITVPFE